MSLISGSYSAGEAFAGIEPPDRFEAEVEYEAAIAGSVVLGTAADLITGDLAVNAAARGRADAALEVKFRESRERADAEAIILWRRPL